MAKYHTPRSNTPSKPGRIEKTKPLRLPQSRDFEGFATKGNLERWHEYAKIWLSAT
jgi:hypothetical protein